MSDFEALICRGLIVSQEYFKYSKYLFFSVNVCSIQDPTLIAYNIHLYKGDDRSHKVFFPFLSPVRAIEYKSIMSTLQLPRQHTSKGIICSFSAPYR